MQLGHLRTTLLQVFRSTDHQRSSVTASAMMIVSISFRDEPESHLHVTSWELLRLLSRTFGRLLAVQLN